MLLKFEYDEYNTGHLIDLKCVKKYNSLKVTIKDLRMISPCIVTPEERMDT